jgi:hypothetical protein
MANLIRGAAGALLFAVALALSLPGASVRADSASSGEALMCRADAPIADPAAVESVVDAVRRRALQAPREDSVRVLNGAGYNYPANRKVDFRALEREMRMGRAGSH